ncbi:MAG: hypothetical protein QXH07_03310 [Thermoplasmata archaeon]
MVQKAKGLIEALNVEEEPPANVKTVEYISWMATATFKTIITTTPSKIISKII